MGLLGYKIIETTLPRTDKRQSNDFLSALASESTKAKPLAFNFLDNRSLPEFAMTTLKGAAYGALFTYSRKSYTPTMSDPSYSFRKTPLKMAGYEGRQIGIASGGLAAFFAFKYLLDPDKGRNSYDNAVAIGEDLGATLGGYIGSLSGYKLIYPKSHKLWRRGSTYYALSALGGAIGAHIGKYGGHIYARAKNFDPLASPSQQQIIQRRSI